MLACSSWPAVCTQLAASAAQPRCMPGLRLVRTACRACCPCCSWQQNDEEGNNARRLPVQLARIVFAQGCRAAEDWAASTLNTAAPADAALASRLWFLHQRACRLLNALSAAAPDSGSAPQLRAASAAALTHNELMGLLMDGCHHLFLAARRLLHGVPGTSDIGGSNGGSTVPPPRWACALHFVVWCMGKVRDAGG